MTRGRQPGRKWENNKKKRLLGILLCLCMVLTRFPALAFAEGGEGETSVCTCETACAAGAMNAECPVCGGRGRGAGELRQIHGPEVISTENYHTLSFQVNGSSPIPTQYFVGVAGPLALKPADPTKDGAVRQAQEGLPAVKETIKRQTPCGIKVLQGVFAVSFAFFSRCGILLSRIPRGRNPPCMPRNAVRPF